MNCWLYITFSFPRSCARSNKSYVHVYFLWLLFWLLETNWKPLSGKGASCLWVSEWVGSKQTEWETLASCHSLGVPDFNKKWTQYCVHHLLWKLATDSNVKPCKVSSLTREKGGPTICKSLRTVKVKFPDINCTPTVYFMNPLSLTCSNTSFVESVHYSKT